MSVLLPRLYKRTATGKLQEWAIEIEGDKYRTISGQQDGQAVTSKWTVAKPKNVGRANATSACQQADVEAKAAWEKKQRDGYHRTPDAAATSEVFWPMLAKTETYDGDHRRKAHVLNAIATTGYVYVQPKMDGVRCIIQRQGDEIVMLSRKNRPLVACPHIAKDLRTFFDQYPELILDGELYNHDIRCDPERGFSELVSLVKDVNVTPEGLEYTKENVQLWLYDCYWGKDNQTSFEARHKFLVTSAPYFARNVVLVPTDTCRTEEALEACYELYLDLGFEGVMIRTNSAYEPGKRSGNLVKRKPFEDHEYKVLGIFEGEGNRSGEAGYATFQMEDGRTFDANITGTQATRLELLFNKEKYIGGEATVCHAGLTEKGKPRFPRVKAWWPGGREL